MTPERQAELRAEVKNMAPMQSFQTLHIVTTLLARERIEDKNQFKDFITASTIEFRNQVVEAIIEFVAQELLKKPNGIPIELTVAAMGQAAQEKRNQSFPIFVNMCEVLLGIKVPER